MTLLLLITTDDINWNKSEKNKYHVISLVKSKSIIKANLYSKQKQIPRHKTQTYRYEVEQTERVKDGEAWHATVHGFAESRRDLATEHAHGYQVGKGGGRDKLGVWGQQIQTTQSR